MEVLTVVNPWLTTGTSGGVNKSESLVDNRDKWRC